MTRINGIRLRDESELIHKVRKILGKEPIAIKIRRKSIDARRKPDVRLVYSVDVLIDGQDDTLAEYKYRLPADIRIPERRPVVAGFGPAGIFAGLILAEAGFRPIILERGKDVDSRRRDVGDFWNAALFNPLSNVQFGEGGAGTFSDGKLTTGVSDLRRHKVISEFLEAGAPEEIAYLSKPHIGTDKLVEVIKRLRGKILSLGGEVRFGHKLEGISSDKAKLTGIRISSPQGTYELETTSVVLAIGHSARDTVTALYKAGVAIEPKAFSVGLRIEHKQSMINSSQYGTSAFGAADYKLSTHLQKGRGVYTFCMCPGGVVVASQSEADAVVVNGMSNYARDGENANSAVLVSVTPEDFPGGALAGIEFQRSLERFAYRLGGGGYKAPVQLVGDFLINRPTTDFGEVRPSYLPGVSTCNLHEILPPYVSESLIAGIKTFDRKLSGFAKYDAVLTGVETRSSSPVRIKRDSSLESVSLKGLYPCGEGAGYAGGIVSAAIDGIKSAEGLIFKAGERHE